jgi:glycosyltransferase involved in cell wall biosynthesis
MSRKRVLIITYYWPPTGASGVQRWLKFAKYLPENGWVPVIYTPENPERPATDHSLAADIPAEAEIITHPIFEPYGLYRKLTGRKPGDTIQVGFVSDSEKPGFPESASRWLRGNFLIPDARKFWIRPSVNKLAHYLGQNPVDAIVSTGPPHSMHLIALRLRLLTGTPWLADFRDPWSGFYYNDDLMFTGRTREKHRRLEKTVLQSASRVITVSRGIKQELEELGGRSVDVIHNGFDPADFDHLEFGKAPSFTITHTGAFQPAANPRKVWEVLGRLVATRDDLAGDLSIALVGRVDSAIKESLSSNGLQKYVHYTGYVPHTEVMRYQVSSSLLLLCILQTTGAEGIITGKFFEYLASGTPVFCIGPENGDTADIIRKCRAGDTAGFEDESAIERIILDYYEKWKKGIEHTQDLKAVASYSRIEQCRALAGMLDGL